jgi:hypothetical protein
MQGRCQVRATVYRTVVNRLPQCYGRPLCVLAA